VRGNFTVAPQWQSMFPQQEYGGEFEIPIESSDTTADGSYEIFAVRKAPPGSCQYIFVMEKGNESICKSNPETLTPRKTHHHQDFVWDLPITDDPYAQDGDSRPSTATSRDGAQVDPNFEQDWDAMRLKSVDSFMKVRLKEVLTEFYAILIDLFDSYAFMGLDLSATQHTIGMDDWKHLILNCGLLEGQPDASLSWSEICSWFEEAAGIRSGKPYLAQRLTRAHYLELLIRLACWVMCEHPKAPFIPEPGRPPMPKDEGLFRFITDILIPVMDVYDEDPIRKDAVEQQTLHVIQQMQPSIRSIYNSLAQTWQPCDGERVLVPSTLVWVLGDVLGKLQGAAAAGDAEPAATSAEGTSEGQAAAAGGGNLDYDDLLAGDQRLSIEQLGCVLETIDGSIALITAKHPEPMEQRALLFWEFFEVLMQSCRELVPALGVQLHDAIPLMVQTLLAYVGLMDRGIVVLPTAPGAEPAAADGSAEEGGGEQA